MRCPVCGYQYGSMKKQGDDINEMLNKRGDKAKGMIRDIHRKIVFTIPSQRLQKVYWSFLKATDHIGDKEIIQAITEFIRAKHINYGRGLSYLRAIIVNKHLDKDKLKELEKKRLGSSPPIRKVKQ